MVHPIGPTGATTMGQDGDMSDGEEVTFAELCRVIRAALGLAQEDLAAHLEVSRKTVQRWERGFAAPDDRVEVLLAAFCRDQRVFGRAESQLAELGIRGWEEVASVLSRSRRGRPPRSPMVPEGVDLVGRESDLAAVESLLAAGRLVTITGPGGVGKTAVARAIAGGWIEKTVLVRPYLFWRLLPDFRTLHMWFRYATRDKRDDTLLLAVIREFERDGITFQSALNYCPELLVKHGFLTRRKPSSAQWRDSLDSPE